MYDFNEKVDRISEHCRKWDRSIIEEHFGKVPDNFIPLWIADMDFKVPGTIANTFLRAVQRGTFGYTYVYDEFYEAVIDWQRHMHHVEVGREAITLTYGTVSTIHYVIQAFCSEDDKILLNTPVYDPFHKAADKQGVVCIYNPLSIAANRYYIDFERLEMQLKEEKPRLYFLCSPHNPSGRIWCKEELYRAAELCKKHNTILVVDEVHGEQALYGDFTSILSLDRDLIDNVILLTSPNKAFNLGGLKTSYTIIPNDEIRRNFKKQLDKNSITSPNVFGILGLIAAYKYSKQWLREVTVYIKGNYEYLESYIEKRIPAIKVMKMEASYLAWINISELGLSSTILTNILASKYGVLVENGKNFVCDGEGWIRINLGTQRENIIEALSRIERCVRDMSSI
ncbi:cystathionine beta-lyase [Anaerosolibacter carboniphilus]|uniref:cysteine-S-conjugate beta-lyase n=1 Tax=Anaerosolibacter carboniphilus TaxID=1417629 RepID=A0A841L4R4_9FIRM|nr:PatB family C-S lyase [Anaerosolibacter carboniphilus]MBB6217315.1 cystathionine beta-lyase [Anaerosolibacter carboniphilus]